MRTIFFIFVILLGLAGCASPQKFVWIKPNTPIDMQQEQFYRNYEYCRDTANRTMLEHTKYNRPPSYRWLVNSVDKMRNDCMAGYGWRITSPENANATYGSHEFPAYRSEGEI